MTSPRRRVLILVGTDHHPFERAVLWADARQRTHPDEDVVIQHGQTPPPSYAAGHSFLPGAQLRELIADATVVVTHGGPGTISDVRAGGHRPIVLARNPAFGEHVDDHQMRFAAWCGRRGVVRLVSDLDELDAVVAELGEQGTREALDDDAAPAGVAVVEALAMAPHTSSRAVLPGSPVVLSVAAASRAGGSQLADALLDVPGALLLGPVTELPARLADPSCVCACGRSPDTCPLWEAVLDQLPQVPVDSGSPSLAGVLPRHLGRARRRALTTRSAGLTRLVSAAVAVAGASVVVDESDLAGVLTLARGSGLDVRLTPYADEAWARLAVVAAGRHHRIPVLRLPGRPSARKLADRLGSLSLPPAGTPAVAHGPDARLSVR